MRTPCGRFGVSSLREALAGLVVQTQRQVQAAEQQLRIQLVVRQLMPVLVGEQPGQGLEVVLLVVVKQHIPVLQILHANRRQLLRVVLRRLCHAGKRGQEHAGPLAEHDASRAATPSP